MQRGDVAIFDKALRAKAAVLGGANLVIELPASYSSASAEFFALNAIKILNALGNVDYLSFGAENADAASLAKIGELLAKEPADPANPLLSSPNTAITPHSAWTSVEARLRLMNIMEQNLASFIETGKGINRVGI